MTSIRPVDWERLLLVFMHDPADKALDIEGRDSRAARYASTALERQVDRNEMESAAALEARLAAIAERPPMPTAGSDGERAGAPVDGRLQIRHPVSGKKEEIDCGSIDEAGVDKVIAGIVGGLGSPKERFLALWRLLPERLDEAFDGRMTRLPADTRIPDHSWIDHADIAAGIWASREQGGQGGAYLTFALGPVQPFIEAARSVRDLWTGSAILSWLSFAAMRPILDLLGPTAFVYPALRGNPLMDLWLRNDLGLDRIRSPEHVARKSPSLPNRFIAVVPWGPDGALADELAERCEASSRAAWARLADDVRARLAKTLEEISPGWDSLWASQVGDFFDIATTTVPEQALDDDAMARLMSGTSFGEAWPECAAIRSLATAMPSSDRAARNSAGRWQARMEFSARLMEAKRSIRHVPGSAERGGDKSPPKCSLFGSWEQMGPADFDQSGLFWKEVAGKLSLDGVRLRLNERFCAVALAKRFSGPALLADEFGLDRLSLRFPDTATIAAAEWLNEAGIDPDEIRRQYGDWSGRWLHGFDDEDKPPAEAEALIAKALRELRPKRPASYLAILKMDGDDIGSWLRGDFSPKLRDVLHPKIENYFQTLGDAGVQGLDARRPVDPALHASISAALGDFAARVAPAIVKRHNGTLIYSGGDDLLALLPTIRAARCAEELQRAFRGEAAPDCGRGMGSRATVSVGISYVHHMEDLRLALRSARDAEHRAKEDGKDAVNLHFMRRSGEQAGATLPWPLASWFTELTELFATGATDRWAYHLRAELPVLATGNLPCEAVAAEIRRLGNRIDDPNWSSYAKNSRPGELIANWWREYRDALSPRNLGLERTLVSFVTLCQGAAFVARGREG